VSDVDDRLTDDTCPSSPVDMRTVMHRAFEALDALKMGRTTLIPSGIDGLDTLTGGLGAAALAVLEGRPRVGKTALALQVAVAVGAERPVLFFSPATSTMQLSSRLLSLRSGVEPETLRGTREPTGEDYARLVQGAGDLEKRHLWFDDAMHLTAEHLVQAARAVAERHPLGLIVVDDAELVVPRAGSEPLLVRLWLVLDELARAFDCPLLATFDLESARAVAGTSEGRSVESLVRRADLGLRLECASRQATPAAGRRLTVSRGGVETGCIELLLDRRRLAFREAPLEERRSKGSKVAQPDSVARPRRPRRSAGQQSLDGQLEGVGGTAD